jgi:hypothetical protein
LVCHVGPAGVWEQISKNGFRTAEQLIGRADVTHEERQTLLTTPRRESVHLKIGGEEVILRDQGPLFARKDHLVAISLTTQWIYLYAAGHQLLEDERRSHYEELVGRVRAVLTVVVVSLSLILAWTDTGLAKYVWLLFLLVPVIGSRIAAQLEAGRTAGVSAGT